MLLLTAREVRCRHKHPGAPNSRTTLPLLYRAVVANVRADDVVGDAVDDKISKNAGILSRR
jgi:hypothetical protein